MPNDERDGYFYECFHCEKLINEAEFIRNCGICGMPICDECVAVMKESTDED